MYYLSCENKDADQLHCNRAADLRLCFCICKKQVHMWLPSWDDLLMTHNICNIYVLIEK